MGSPIRADELFAAWSRGQWKPCYLFAGQEDLLIEQAVHQAIRHWLGDPPESLNIDRLDAETHSVDDILQAARTMPFFGTHRFIGVANAGQLSHSDQECLAEFLVALPAECHLLFLWGPDWRREDANKPLAEAVAAMGQVVIFWTLFPEQAQRWLVDRAKQYKKTLQPEAAAWLVQQMGEGLRLLDQELAKCSTYVGERPEIDLEDVQNSFGYAKSGSPFEWAGGIRQRKASQALRVLEQLLKEGEEPVRLLALLTRNLRDWLAAKGTGESAGMLAMRFRLRRGDEQRFVQDLARWSEENLVESLRLCVEAEQSIKTGKETPEMALTVLSLALCRLESVEAAR